MNLWFLLTFSPTLSWIYLMLVGHEEVWGCPYAKWQHRHWKVMKHFICIKWMKNAISKSNMTNTLGGYGWRAQMTFLWCHVWVCKFPQTASNIHTICIKCLSTFRCYGWAYRSTLTLLYLLCARCTWGWILKRWGMAEPKWCCDVMVEAANPRILHPTYSSYMYSECLSTLTA